MLSLLHTSRRSEVVVHPGFCATDSDDVSYGHNAFTVEIDTTALRVVEVVVSREDIDLNNWPGDSKRSLAALAADGIDLVVYEDMDESGRGHTTYRIVTDRAAAATTIAPVPCQDEDND